jgi:hypothetical protein
MKPSQSGIVVQFNERLAELCYSPTYNTYYNPMKKLRICRSLLPFPLGARHSYMHYNGRLDYLGQMLEQQGYRCEGKFRTPAALDRIITPFTFSCRGIILDSITTLRILALDRIDRTEHETILNEIMAEHNYEIIWE